MMRELLPGLSSHLDLHPVLVHFPIAAWVFALALALWALSRRDVQVRARAEGGARWLLLVGTGFAIAALVTGYLAADDLGHDTPGHELVHTHRDLMLSATIAAALASLAGLLARAGVARRALRAASLVGLALAVVLTTLGADRGAMVAHGMSPAHPPGRTHDHGEAGEAPDEPGHPHGATQGHHDEADHDHAPGTPGHGSPGHGAARPSPHGGTHGHGAHGPQGRLPLDDGVTPHEHPRVPVDTSRAVPGEGRGTDAALAQGACRADPNSAACAPSSP